MKFYVTTPIYYVNDKPHIGHAYSTIAADVLARWHRQQGHAVRFLTGTAEHGTKIADSAQAAGQSPQNFVDANVKFFQQAWQKLNIKYDDFIRTTETRHAKAVTLFFEKLKQSGKLYEDEYEGLYCVGHEAFMKESDLDKHGNCPDHGKPPKNIKERNWFFKLSDYHEFLKHIITSGKMKIDPVERRNEVLSLINQGLEDVTISRRTAKNALPLPWDDSQTIYVWLDELFNYCSAIGYGSDNETFNRYWPADLHIIGKDILKFHCVIWPALLDAIGEPVPRRVFAHGFFTVNGQKISKSLGNAIDPVELANAYGADAVRYYLLRDIPFGNDGDFSHARLKNRYNADLANGLGNLVSRVLNMIESFLPLTKGEPEGVASEEARAGKTGAGETPGVDEETPGVEEAPIKEGRLKLNSVDTHLQNLAFDRALETIWHAISDADELIEKTKPWELAKAGETEKVKNTLGQLYEALVAINAALAPFLPDTHRRLAALLKQKPLKKPPEPLFPRIG